MDVAGQADCENAAATDVTAFIPPSLAHAERTVNVLMRHYPRHQRSACEEATGALCGHANWLALVDAIRSGDAGVCYDDDLPPARLQERRARQHGVLLSRLLGMQDEHRAMAQRLDQEVLRHDREAPITKRYDAEFTDKRMRRAAYAYHMAYARQVIETARPTALAPRPVPADLDDIDLGMRVELLPRALSAWLAHHTHVPLSQRLEVARVQVRQQATTDLLDFSFLWAEMWMTRAGDIPRPLQIYPIVLCARWYAWVNCARMSELRGAVSLIEMAGEESSRRRAAAELEEAIRAEEALFILTQPREEFRLLSQAAREEQLRAGAGILRRYMAAAAHERAVGALLSRPAGFSGPPYPAAA